MVTYDAKSFSAGQACGTRVAGGLARLAALELMADKRWWNRRRRRLMAGALITLAEEMEGTASADMLAWGEEPILRVDGSAMPFRWT